MKVKGVDGKFYSWSLAKYVGNENSNPSDLHLRVREFLEDNYPALQILEEVKLPDSLLYLDFYLPVIKIACEAQGQQHDEFSLYMHKDKLSYSRSKGRDNRKAEFCRINNIKLVYFYPYEKEEEWRKKMGIQ